jgi:hypothetical protein
MKRNNRWLNTRVPGRLGVVIAFLGAVFAGFEFWAYTATGGIIFLITALLIFALAGWAFAASVRKLRYERAQSNDQPK